jgi:predicted nuclease of restriction endonuclease-like (RecB) superfamily
MNFQNLAKQITSLQKNLQASVAHAINTGLTLRNWLIGCYIVEFEQNGEDRAKYGEKLLACLEKKIKQTGMTERRFREYRRFYLVYPQIGDVVERYLPSDVVKKVALPSIRRTVSAESSITNKIIRRTASAELEMSHTGETLLSRLPYSHLYEISKIENPLKRVFYEMECIKGSWTIRELERQINSLYYERSGLSKNKKALSALVNKKSVALEPKDVINSPFSFEFLGLNERALVTESDLEQAVLDHLQSFLLEMGHGMCFEGRQKRILIDDDYFFIDLLFYHRILKCHIVVELKVDKFKHEYASQLNLYLNYIKNEMMASGDNPPVGLLLCTEHGNTQVKYALAGLDKNIFVKKYMVELPNEKTLKDYISKEIYQKRATK